MPAYNLEKVCEELAKSRDIKLAEIDLSRFFKNKKVEENLAPYKNYISEDPSKTKTLIGNHEQFFFAYYGEEAELKSQSPELLYMEDSKLEIVLYRNIPNYNDYLLIKNKKIFSSRSKKEIREFFTEKDFIKEIDIQFRQKNKPIYLFLEKILEKPQEAEKKEENKKYSFRIPYKKKKK